LSHDRKPPSLLRFFGQGLTDPKLGPFYALGALRMLSLQVRPQRPYSVPETAGYRSPTDVLLGSVGLVVVCECDASEVACPPLDAVVPRVLIGLSWFRVVQRSQVRSGGAALAPSPPRRQPQRGKHCPVRKVLSSESVVCDQCLSRRLAPLVSSDCAPLDRL
jgi:hypothetical protein